MTLSARRRLVAALVLVAALFWPWPASPKEIYPAEFQKFSRVEFRGIDGTTLRLEDLRGKIVLVDFWATWCAPCLADMPRLKKLHTAYPDDLAIIGVSLDRIDRRDFTSWVRRNGITWMQVQEARGYNGDLARLFEVEELPVTVLFDREGRLIKRNLRADALETAIRALINPRDTRR